MALLSSIIDIRSLAALNEHQLDVLVAALDAELLTNAAVKKAVAGKIQTVHRGLAGGNITTGKKESKG